MRRLGELLDAPRTDDAVRELERAVAAQKRTRANAPRVMFAVWTDPLYVAGRDTFTDDLFALTGARNAVEVDGLAAVFARVARRVAAGHHSLSARRGDAAAGRRAAEARARAAACVSFR